MITVRPATGIAAIDSESIKDALDEAASKGVGIYLPAGTYNLINDEAAYARHMCNLNRYRRQYARRIVPQMGADLTEGKS